MTDLDDKLIPKAEEIVTKLGISVVFYVETGGSYDPDTGHTTEGTISQVSEKVTPPEDYSDYFIASGLVKRGDVKIYLPSKDLTFTPSPGMKVYMNTVYWKIVEANPHYSGEEIALYELQMRR